MQWPGLLQLLSKIICWYTCLECKFCCYNCWGKRFWFCVYSENHKKDFIAVTTTKYYFTATAAVRRLFAPILAERTFLAIYSCWKSNFTNVSIVVTEKGKILLLYLLRINILLRMILLKKRSIDVAIEEKCFATVAVLYQYIATVILNFVNTSYWFWSNHRIDYWE